MSYVKYIKKIHLISTIKYNVLFYLTTLSCTSNCLTNKPIFVRQAHN